MKTETSQTEVCVLLDNIRSVHNVGAIFRTCDALGIRKIFLCGITPTPIDRFGRSRDDLHKAALGSEKTVAWKYHSSSLEVVLNLKKEGYTVISIEQDKKSVDYKTVTPENKTLFVFGNEVDGVQKDIIEQSDFVAEIPMRGTKESLNVSVSFGIVMFRLLDK